MHFLTQALLTTTLFSTLVLSLPQEPPMNGGGGGVQGNCNFFCCERNLGTGGTLCKNNTAIPHPFSDDCSTMPIGNKPNGSGKATPVCCANANCWGQPGWWTPITSV
ncbi:hypothetical protein ACHAO1_007792 [Botrytis cinerea]